MWVVKLGGSLLGSAHLAPWLQALCAQGGRVVVVPGGGPFADAVRAAQRRHRFSDAAAHELALLAMEQFAVLLRHQVPALVLAADTGSMRRVLDSGGVPLWMPHAMMAVEDALPRDWSVTSDSLGLFLAARLGARGYLLVKSAPLPAARSVRELAREGLVDAAFPELARVSGAPVAWLEGGEWGALATLLDGGPGARRVVEGTGDSAASRGAVLSQAGVMRTAVRSVSE